jgi:transposase
VQCKVCGSEHEVGERRAWLLERARDMIVTVREASQYLGEVGGIKVSQASIRGYLHRGKLAYRPGVENGIRLGDLLSVVLDESERKSA